MAKADVRRVRDSLGLGDRPYVAFLGTFAPRKNVPALVRAWAAVVADRDQAPAFVLAGGRGWDTDVDHAVAAVPGHLSVLHPDYLPLEELAAYTCPGPTSPRTPASARGSAFRCWRRWPAVPRC